MPCQHHFNTATSREIFGLFVGPGIEAGRVVDHTVRANQVAATVATAMGFDAEHAEGSPLEEAFA